MKQLVKENDTTFVFLLKELIKVEITIALAQLKEKGVAPGQNVLVIIKGLEDETKQIGMVTNTDVQ
ncbi:MAG: hypothetical protein ABSB79_08585 [Syntrophales bacterium]